MIGTPYLTATGTSKDGQTTKVVKARYKSGSETRNLVFEYLLQDDDGLGSGADVQLGLAAGPAAST